MANYPDWVLRHKEKGTYINFQNGKYYLYAAHSERIPGTGKVKRVSDGYIGRITEEDGLIPAKRKLVAPVYALEYGLSETIFTLCPKILTGLAREFRANADFVMAGGMLLFMHGEIQHELYQMSWMSQRLPFLRLYRQPTEKQRIGMERVQRMITDALVGHFGDSFPFAVSCLPLVRAVCMGAETIIAEVPFSVSSFLKLHGLRLEEVGRNG
jgi:hypothetical protein